jgi:hypothetical protein
VAITKPHNNIPPDGNHRKTVDDTHDGTQDDLTRLKLSECSKPNEKEAIHFLEQLLTDERKKSALSEVRAGAAAKTIKILQEGRLQSCNASHLLAGIK